jgi:putative spermidine/putrescine transport system substrate-binding protein
MPYLVPALRRHLSRRAVLQGLAAASAATLPAGSARAAGPIEKDLVFACNGGILEKLFRAMGAPFEKETGCKITYVAGTQLSNLARIRAAKASPDIDVVFNSDLSHAAGKPADLYEKLDPAVVTNLKDVYAEALDPQGIGVASALTSIGIGYNTQKFQEAGIPPITSWNDLWDPRLKGRVAICSFSVTWIQDFVALMARLNGGSEADIKPGIAKIKQLKTMGNLAFIPNSPAELENLLTQGTAWATVTASVRGFGLRDQGYPFDFVYPKEGASFYANWMDVVRNAPHPHAAQAFVSHVLSPAAQLIMAGGFYGPTNKTVTLPPDLARKAPYGTERIASLVKIDRDRMNADLDQWSDAWNREIEAGR